MNVTGLVVILLTPWMLLAMLTSAQNSDGRCSRKVSRSTSYQESFQTSSSQKYYTKCGVFNWSSCTRYRTVYSRSTRLATRLTYATEYECCPGWIDQGKACLPTTTPTTTEFPTTTFMFTNSSIFSMGMSTAPNNTITPSKSSTSNRSNSDPSSERATAIAMKTSKATVATLADETGGGASSPSNLMSNPATMMIIGCFALLVFLAILIGAIFCAVRKYCPRKNRVSRLHHRSSSVRSNNSGGDQARGAAASNGEMRIARPKVKRPPKGMKGNTFAASNPSYNMHFIAVDEAINENSYEMVDTKNKELPAPPLPDKPSFCVDVKGADKPGKVLENAYVSVDEETTMVLAMPPSTGIEALTQKTPESCVDVTASPTWKKPLPPTPTPKKPVPKSKPAILPRKDLQRAKTEPPSAANHLVLPPIKKSPYLNMSKAQQNCDQDTHPLTIVKGLQRQREEALPQVPRKLKITKATSVDEISNTQKQEETISRSKTLGGTYTAPDANIYDIVTGKGKKAEFRRGSDSRLASPSEGGYVLPGTVTPSSVGSRTDLAEDFPGIPRPISMIDDSYSPLTSAKSSTLDISVDNNEYDFVMAPAGESHTGGVAGKISSLGYATPRQTSFDDCPYENQKRTSVSLPQKSKQSAPVPQLVSNDVYDTVPVKEDRPSVTLGRTSKPKISPRKPLPTPSSGETTHKSKYSKERQVSGPSTLKNEQLDTVYVNTSRY